MKETNKMEYTYLAIPYTFNPELSYKIATKVAAKLASEGIVVFSPVTHSHPMSKYLLSELQCDHNFWMKQDLPLLKYAKDIKLIVIGDNGMQLIENSRGCQDELRQSVIQNKPISYYYYDYKQKY